MSDVCNCPNKDHTLEICIGQIQEHQREINKYFTMMSEHCDFNINSECQKGDNIVPCRIPNCLLLLLYIKKEV
jgi:hypothetical protein